MTQSPESQPEEDVGELQVDSTGTENRSIPHPSHRIPRKRTKTGCLTCRKRRIKCGEEKPICSNCTKSKRFCEGYNPRIGYRHPPSSRSHADGAFNFKPPLSNFASFADYPSPYPRLSSGVSTQPLRPIAPTPLLFHQQNYLAISSSNSFPGGANTLGSTDYNPLAGPSAFPLSADVSGTFPLSSYSSGGEGTISAHPVSVHRHASFSGPRPSWQPWVGAPTTEQEQSRPFFTRSNTLSFTGPTGSQMPDAAFSSVTLPPESIPSQNGSGSDNQPPLTSTQIAAYGDQPLAPDHPFYTEVKAHYNDARLDIASAEDDPARYSAQGFIQRPSFNLSIPLNVEGPPSAPTSQINYEEEEDEDDPWDVEMDVAEDNIHPSEQSKQDLGNMLIRHASHGEGRGARSFTTFLNEKNILASYRPSHSALPQADKKAARIFCHFVSSTGPSLTIFERAATPQAGRTGVASISGFQQPLWAYTLPSMALDHPPLMHAMLALSALHISKLQQTSPGPSIKHFTYALRRVGRLIGLPKRRNEVTTFAANLLLGFYEVMSAETSKWNIHLTGARVLAMEIDFAGKTRKLRALRARLKDGLSRLDPDQYTHYISCAGIPESLFPDQDWEVDENLISTFTGYNVRYDDQYQTNIPQPTHQNLEFTAKDVELYKMQADLYWWFCKQDIFQSMISGNRLLMPYDHWVFCPPRGQIGQLDLIYATMDHLCLIMARLADFGGKDSVRKRKTVAAAAAATASSAQSSQSQASQFGAPVNSQPAGHPLPQQQPPPAGKGGPPLGYMPSPDHPQPMHSAFATMSANLHDTAFPSSQHQTQAQNQPPLAPSTTTLPMEHETSLSAETEAAFAEHASISQALDLFAQSLPAEFGDLAPDAAPPISTPFGPALQYRTHTISCIWAFYYSGRILLARLHPAMPPAAMISAQAAAHHTAQYAQKIGKICAGLYYPQQYNLQIGALNPSLGGALIESTFSLFFAAVQFTDHAQRGWTINKLKEIARLSGWQTAAAVAAGCEFAWQAMGKAGRGPEYRPTMDWRNKDDRVGDKVLKNEARGKEMAEKGRRGGGGDGRENKMGAVGGGEQEEGEEEKEKMRRQQAREEQYFVAAGKDGPPTLARGGRRRRSKVEKKFLGTGRAGLNGEAHGFHVGGQGIGHENGGVAVKEDEGGEYDDDDDGEPAAISHDRKTIGTNPYARTHWALGLLSLDEDIAKLEVGK